MRFLDANIFLRLLTGDDERKSADCLTLFRRLDSGDEVATTSESIIAEIVYVLSSRSLYHLSRDEIRQRLHPILQLRGLRLTHKSIYFRALEIYEDFPSLDFEDALSVAHMEYDEIIEIVSYDRDFDRVPKITRIEPVAAH